MESKEIKKAFEQMKKAAVKEIGIKYGFSMTTKQIANRTATLLVCNTFPFELDNSGANPEFRKAEHKKYGTKENQLAKTFEAVKGSKAFAEFAKHFDSVRVSTEQNGNFYYIRFDY